jgi:HK97 family phage portal protein
MRFLKNYLTRKLFDGGEWKKGLILPGNVERATHPYSQSTMVSAAIRAIASNLPQVRIKFWYPSTEVFLPLNHPLYKLLANPNEYDNYYTFFEKATTWLALSGECFIYRTQSAGQAAGISQIPAELHVLNSYKMREVLSSNRRDLIGWVYDNSIAINMNELFLVKFVNPYNPFRGLAPIDACINDVDSDFLSSKYGSNFFKNSAIPGLVFTTQPDDESTAEQRRAFLAEWNALHQGSTKAHKAAVLASGMDIKQVGLDQKSMQYIESRKFNAERILSAFGVPPPMVGIYDEATYGNVRTAKKIFWSECIKNYSLRFESEFNKWLMNKFEPDIECWFDFSQVDELKHDAKELADIINVYLNHGVPFNALVDAFDLPVEKQENLDVGYLPFSMVPVGSTVNTFAAVNSNDESKSIKKNDNISKDLYLKQTSNKWRNDYLALRKVSENLFYKELKNYFYNQRVKIIENLLKIKNEEFNFDNIISAFDIFEKEDSKIVSRFSSVYESISKEAISFLKSFINSTSTTNTTSIVENFTSNIRLINITTKNMLIDIAKKKCDNKNQLIDEVKVLFNSFTKSIKEGVSRASLISNMESTGIINATFESIYKDEGIHKKMWVSDEKGKHAERNGTIKHINEGWHSEYGNDLKYPGDPNASTKEIVQCNCVIFPIIDRR